MKTHNLVQGTPEWLAHRSTHFNASDAPAMMGCSAYITRTELLTVLKTSIVPTVDASTQFRFDEGHRFEALARPLAEEIIGEDLYPVVGSEGELSASFDGLTMAEDMAFEHKTLNEELRKAFAEIDTMAPQYRETVSAGACLPKPYRVQMEQQLIVSGAESVLFMASTWKGDTLIEERHCWYESDKELRAEIIAGWKQFAQDLATYVPQEVAAPVVAQAAENLPIVFDMRVEGKLVSCNIEQYKPAALAYIEAINIELTTDQHFANADADAKFCRSSADKLNLAIEQALGQMGDINTALNAVREIAAAFDAKGLLLEKRVKSEKENRRIKIVNDATEELRLHVVTLNGRTRNWMPQVQGKFQEVVRGLKSVDSMRDKVATELARCKIEANAIADRIQYNAETLDEAVEFAFLFRDSAQIVLKESEDCRALIKSRIADHKAAEAAKEEAQRERIRQEEEAKARKKVLDETLAANVKAQAAITEARKADAMPAPLLDELSKVGNFLASDAIADHAIQKASIKAATPPTLALGAISERLGFNVTSAFLATLGFEATTVKAAKLFHDSDFPLICRALIEHIESVCETA